MKKSFLISIEYEGTDPTDKDVALALLNGTNCEGNHLYDPDFGLTGVYKIGYKATGFDVQAVSNNLFDKIKDSGEPGA